MQASHLSVPFHKDKGLALKGLPEERVQNPCRQQALLLTKLFAAVSLQYTDPSPIYLLVMAKYGLSFSWCKSLLMSSTPYQILAFAVKFSSLACSRSIDNVQQVRASET